MLEESSLVCRLWYNYILCATQSNALVNNIVVSPVSLCSMVILYQVAVLAVSQLVIYLGIMVCVGHIDCHERTV